MSMAVIVRFSPVEAARERLRMIYAGSPRQRRRIARLIHQHKRAVLDDETFVVRADKLVHRFFFEMPPTMRIVFDVRPTGIVFDDGRTSEVW